MIRKITDSFRYQLRSGSRKDICPHCERRSFTPYVDSEGNTLSDDVGRCDHQQSCGYHYPPSEYIKDNKLWIPLNHVRRNQRGNRKPPSPPSYIDPSDLLLSMGHYERNSLMRYIHSIFDGLIGSEEVNRVSTEMAIGTSKQFGGSPVFWLIDHTGRIRDGKIMGYDSKTGKRIKDPRPLFNNVHSLMKEKYQGTFKPCFFGSHTVLNNENRNLPIWLFESEKAALIVSMAFVWGGCKLGLPMASGGCESFNPTEEHKQDPYDRVRVLKGQKVVLFPDEGKYHEWKLKGHALRGFSSEVKISTAMESSLHSYKVRCEIKEGDGFDDLLIRYFLQGYDVSELLLTYYS